MVNPLPRLPAMESVTFTLPRKEMAVLERVAASLLDGGTVSLDAPRSQDERSPMDRGVAALQIIVNAVRDHAMTGQGRRLIAFLAGIYHGQRFPFDLTDLRALDTRLSDACLEVLAFDRTGAMEVHCWGVVSAVELNEWFQSAGLYYRAQSRRLGRELYQGKYGDKGHDDLGLTE